MDTAGEKLDRVSNVSQSNFLLISSCCVCIGPFRTASSFCRSMFTSCCMVKNISAYLGWVGVLVRNALIFGMFVFNCGDGGGVFSDPCFSVTDPLLDTRLMTCLSTISFKNNVTGKTLDGSTWVSIILESV